MSETTTRQTPTDDYDVVIVGGGPAGCSAGVFCARYGLDTAIFDRGRSSLRRLAHLENYLGFPGGIDIETFYELMHDHAEEAGCTILGNLVEAVEKSSKKFVVEPQEGDSVAARRVIAAARYDGEFLKPLDAECVMFESYEYDGEEYEQFDREYPEADGTTPVEGLYVASPSEEADAQALIAAGRGARVAKRLIEDVKREDEGLWEMIVDYRDWVFLDEGYTDGDWEDDIRERFDDSIPVDSTRSEEGLDQLREKHVEEKLSQLISREEQEQRQIKGQKRVAERLDDEVLLDALDDRELLTDRPTADGNGGS